MSAISEEEEFEFRLRAEQEGSSAKSALAVPPAPTSKPDMSWSSVPGAAIGNFLPSAGNLVRSLTEAVMHPIDTGKGLLDIAAGGVQNVLPESLVQAVGEDKASREKASAVGNFYKNRYGTESGFKDALANDPVGVMADASTLLTGGAGLANKVGLAKTGGALTAASRAVDPMLQSVKLGEKIIKPVGSGIANVLGGIGTHTGGESIKAIANAGFRGGSEFKSAAAQLRGTAPVTDVLDKAQSALTNVMQNRSADYVNSMRKVANNQTVLDFGEVDNAVQKALNINTFKGKSISPTTAGIQDDIVKVVDDWKNSNPADFHTIEGFDALKRSIGSIRDTTEFGTPARRVADTVYNSIKDTIVKLDPEYAKVMQKYSEASETISEIQRHLLGKEKGSPITAIRKLQNLMSVGSKNNSMELNLANELEKAGATGLRSDLAGIAMQGWVPRMLSGRLGAGIGTAIVAANNPVVAGALLPLQSPRLVGEAALGTGRAAGIAARLIGRGRDAVQGAVGTLPYDNLLYQSNLLNERANEKPLGLLNLQE